MLYNIARKHAVRILIGVTFIVSAVLKMISVDSFEVYIFSLQWFGLSASTIIARLIISVEAMMGVLLIINYRFDLLKKLTVATLGVFSVFLLMQIARGETENCQCFGTIIQLSPAESLLKNFILLALLFSAWKNTRFELRHSSSVALFSIVFLLALPPLLSPPDFMMQYPAMPENALAEANKRLLASGDLTEYGADTGKKIVCMYSVQCAHCIRTANMISVMAEKNKWDDEILYVFAGDPAELPAFWKESHSIAFNHLFLPSRTFFSIAGPSVPSIYLVDNGKIIQHFHARNISETEITTFLAQ